jgi:hypothetical protein
MAKLRLPAGSHQKHDKETGNIESDSVPMIFLHKR